MKNEIKTWLADIKQAIGEVIEFVPESESFAEFKQDLKTRRAVERNIEIIGEALNRSLKQQPDIPITHARTIVDTRNRIIHGYDTVSEEILWSIVVRDLNVLEEEIDKLLDE